MRVRGHQTGGRTPDSAGPPADLVLVFDAGDPLPDVLLDWAAEREIASAQLSGIGAFESVVLGYFDPLTRQYVNTRLDEQVEVLSFLGNLTRFDGVPRLHAHVVLGRRDGTTLGGHLVAARVRPTLEVFARTMPEPLERRLDPSSGLPLIDLP